MRAAFLLLLSAALAAAAAAPAAAGSASTGGPPVFVLAGQGWGHGVGMSQWGAYGQALAGRGHRQILAHYYRGTTIGAAPRTLVRVLLAEGRKRVRISSDVPFRVRAGGRTYRLPAGRVVLGPKARLRVHPPSGPKRVGGDVLVLPGLGGPLSLDGAAYRGGLHVVATGGSLRVVNQVRLEAYLLGVVPLEVPKEWPAEALEAQAVAARSYALAKRLGNGPFDLYPDWRSQMYGGIAAEAPSTSAAVRATAGQVVLYGGSVATTFFFSTSGGRTASAAEVFGDDVPYLVSVPDPWDRASPLHRWAPRPLSPAALGRLLGLGSPVADAVTEHAGSGRSSRLVVRTKAGRTVALATTDLRDRLGLRSAWVQIGMLQLGRGAAPARRKAMATGGVELSGVARELGQAVLERQRPDGGWEHARRLDVAADGTFSVVVRPKETTRFRLAADGFASSPVTVRVRPAG
jgi:stage II sporulation protein D